MASQTSACGNCDPGGTACTNSSKYACKNCLLIAYCSPECQKAHWTHHRPECKSPLGLTTWQPSWIQEGRVPTFLENPDLARFNGDKYLWGDVPAIDILQLEANEGASHDRDLNILFAASGDLRNVVKTITQLPTTYTRSIEAVINDRDLDITARNVILLLVAFVVENTEEAVDCIIHLWYSALVRKSDFDILSSKIRPLIKEVCDSGKEKPPIALLAKTWKFRQCSLRVIMEKSSWMKLLGFLEVPAGLTADNAQVLRMAVTVARKRIDYHHRRLHCQSPSRRIATFRFSKDGLLLPFGADRSSFTVPNPTLFHGDYKWPLRDDADPLDGWFSDEVAAMSSGAATADIYGKLFNYLRTTLGSFLGCIRSRKISFQLHQVDVVSLIGYGRGQTFDRVEVSSISDFTWLGTMPTLSLMGPMLRPPYENPHATLITLYMDMVSETITREDRQEESDPRHATAQRLNQYLPRKPWASTYDPELFKSMLAMDLVTDPEKYFQRYADRYDFPETSRRLSLAMKANNTIVDKWPYRLKLQPGQPGAQEEFDRAIAGGVKSTECCVEWKRYR